MATYNKTVTVAGGYFVIGGGANASYALNTGDTITFNLNDASNATHPLVIGPTNNNDSDAYGSSEGVTYTVSGATYATAAAYETAYLSAKGSSATAAVTVSYTVPSGVSGTIYYFCAVHSGMGNSLVLTDTSLDEDVDPAGSNQPGFKFDAGIPASGMNQVASTDLDVPNAGGVSENYCIFGPVRQASGNSVVAGNLTVFNSLNIEGQLNITGNVDIR
jgi:plastocyanin